MIQLPTGNLPANVETSLGNYQQEVDAGLTYALRVEAAKSLFGQRNRRDNHVFSSVRECLDQMCRGPRRCMYCEDSLADEVEHFRPKDLYPEFVFAWENYLYACGPCNGPKNNQFAIFSTATGAPVELRRLRGEPIQEPEPGDPLLIDPRHEDPLTLLRLDLRDTFLFQEVHPDGTNEHTRARYTIQVLHLNDREYLRVAREIAYMECYGILHLYVSEKGARRPQVILDRKIAAIRRKAHPTVWAEMKRQRDHIAEIRPLFDAAPEALEW
jgi:uncharacterized protein (TIGR02646 family)